MRRGRAIAAGFSAASPAYYLGTFGTLGHVPNSAHRKPTGQTATWLPGQQLATSEHKAPTGTVQTVLRFIGGDQAGRCSGQRMEKLRHL
jgi:hypothetical protein